MPYDPPPDLAALSLAQIAELAAARHLPPIAQWRPTIEGDSLMHITRDGRWWHDGGEIAKPAMIRAFASILARDHDGRHWLMTPTQKLSIVVDDAAFVAVDLRHDADGLAFRLNTDDLVIAGSDHPIRAAGERDVPALYVTVRNGTEARLNRSTYAQLLDIALDRYDEADAPGEELAITSLGMRFALQPR